MNKNSQTLLVIVIGLAAFALGGYFYLSQHSKTYSKQTQVYEPSRNLTPFELEDHLGQPFTNADLKGQWSLVFLGYLSCPDVCPMTMAKLSKLLPDLQAVANQPVKILFVSVDPLRDKAENRAQYVSYFHEDVIGLGAEHVSLFPFVRNLGMMYSVPEPDQTDYYFVDHSASVVLLNPQGDIHAIFKPNFKPNQVPTVDTKLVLADFTTMLN
jgi:protein SCO1/2